MRHGNPSELLNTGNCSELIVDAWREHALGRLTLVFTTDVAHARDLCFAFQSADIKSAWVSGETPIDERRDILTKFASGDIEVLTNCAVLTEGYWVLVQPLQNSDFNIENYKGNE